MVECKREGVTVEVRGGRGRREEGEGGTRRGEGTNLCYVPEGRQELYLVPKALRLLTWMRCTRNWGAD